MESRERFVLDGVAWDLPEWVADRIRERDTRIADLERKGDVLAGANAVLKDRNKELEGLCKDWARWAMGFQHLGAIGRDILERTDKALRGKGVNLPKI